MRLRALVGLVLLGTLLAGRLTSGNLAHAATVGYSTGWHLVSGPTGTVFRGATTLYALDSASGEFVPLPVDRPVVAGLGYFAYFGGLINVRMAPDQHDAVTVTLPPRTWTLVGNPSSFSPATVSGADAVYVYDIQAGYIITTSVLPGSGAMVYSDQGGAATIRPVPGGVDTLISRLEDALIDAAIGPQDVPSTFALTRAEASGSNNGNVPVQYVEDFRPRAAPKSGDAQQTTLITVNIQQAKDADYAAILLNGTTPALLKGIFGANTQAVDQLDPPAGLGDAARAFHLRIVSGNNQAGIYLLAFTRGRFYVIASVVAPLDREDRQLLTSLASTQDQRLSVVAP